MGKGGGNQAPKYYHDYTAWSDAERAFVTQEGMEELQTAYDQGYLSMSPAQLAEYAGTLTTEAVTTETNTTLAGLNDEVSDTIYGETEEDNIASWIANNSYDIQAIQKYGLTPESWANYERSYIKEQGAIQAGIEAEHQQMLEARDELIAGGIPAYTLDPTPWDEITTADQSIMNQLQVDYVTEQKRLEEEAAAAAEALAKEEAIQADIDTMTELASLRNESETLATADVDEYILEKTQAMKLRGITPPFNDAVRDQLINTRFAEYWSTANEEQLRNLMSIYGAEYGYPDITDRVLGGSVTSLLDTTTEEEIENTAALVGTATDATLLTKQLLLDELEVLGAETLLGG